ncbi:cold shock and DUF1294 domain-containing protein [Castellaniella sp.]|uniref:cold shock and DUF1294 domain-containing protein n=1 Tax=Castellaniella sp. TaxID=1955812 RepID=UPI002AFEF3D7|nr:cold shock and DUF1294 domain-containing protein [Castellaniella sp.]
MRHQGQITTWKDDRGFGFIAPSGGGEQVFVHINSFSNRLRRPEIDEFVTYELGADAKGRSQAKAVAFIGERATMSKASGRSDLLAVLAVCFLILIAGAALVGWIPNAVLALYIVASIVAFLSYARDKSAALRHQWRTRERTLHLFALLGGWPGALIAQRLLRHKSSKVSFQVIFWATVVLNCGALGWLLSPLGAEILNELFAIQL